MFKIIVMLVLVMCAYGVQGRCNQVCKSNSLKVCAADRQIVNCQRMTQCQLERANCRRRLRNQPIIINVALSRCSQLKHPGGKGPCAPVKKRG